MDTQNQVQPSPTVSGASQPLSKGTKGLADSTAGPSAVAVDMESPDVRAERDRVAGMTNFENECIVIRDLRKVYPPQVGLSMCVCACVSEQNGRVCVCVCVVQRAYVPQSNATSALPAASKTLLPSTAPTPPPPPFGLSCPSSRVTECGQSFFTGLRKDMQKTVETGWEADLDKDKGPGAPGC